MTSIFTDFDKAHLTEHAHTRAAQRGATDDSVALVVRFGDIEYPAAVGRRRLRLSRRRSAELVADGLTADVVYKAQRIELIVDDEDLVITVLRCDPAPARLGPRSYSRPCASRRR